MKLFLWPLRNAESNQKCPKAESRRLDDMILKLFLSSTFHDMSGERDHLITVVYPELEERLEPLGLVFYDVDLRWGVPDGSVSWKACKEQINEAGNFFVALLGQRYGSIVDPDDLEEDASIVAENRPSFTEMEIRYAAFGSVDRAACQPHADQQRSSRTCLFYFRDNPPDDVLPLIPDVFFDRDTPTPPSILSCQTASQERLEKLKTEIAARYTGARAPRKYGCRWSERGPEDFDAFGKLVLDDLWSTILRDERFVPDEWWQMVVPEKRERTQVLAVGKTIDDDKWQELLKEVENTRSELDKENTRVRRFRSDQVRHFVGRDKLLEGLENFVLDDNGALSKRSYVRLVHAPPGRGKTAFLCKLADKLEKSAHHLDVIECYVGASDGLCADLGDGRLGGDVG